MLDLWGVVHDGQKPYPGVPEALAELKGRGKRVVFLTNAPRRCWAVQTLLDRMGLDARSMTASWPRARSPGG